MSDVVDGLPVLVVDRWSDVTPDRLVRPEGSLEKITQAYWTERIQSYGENIKGA